MAVKLKLLGNSTGGQSGIQCRNFIYIKLLNMAVPLQRVLHVVILTVLSCSHYVTTQVLTPPYFNLAVGRRITATSTCGVGVSESELYCKLTGANPGNPSTLEPHFTVIRYLLVLSKT